MIAELKKYYRAVLCSRCNEPIPVPMTVVSLQDEIEGNTAFSFAARCRMCEDESVYTVADVKNVEGAPRARILRSRAARV